MRKAIVMTAIVATLVGASAFSAAAEEDILGLMRESNLNEALVANNNGRVAYRGEEYDAEGNIYSSYQYADTNRLVFEMPHEIIIVEDEGVYGFDNENKMPYARLYLDDTFDNEAFFITSYMWDPAEILIESYEEDGLLVVHTQSMEASLEEFLMAAGYEWEGEYAAINEYKLDPETYEIMECNYQAFMEGIGTVPMSHVERVTDPAEYEVAKEITDIVFSDDTRTVTIIADPDTDSETVISKTVGKGCRVNVYLSWVHPYLYTDRACTMLLNEEIDPNFDIQLYTRREEIKDVPTQQATAPEMVQCDVCGEWFEAGNAFRNHECISYPEE